MRIFYCHSRANGNAHVKPACFEDRNGCGTRSI